MHIGAPKEIKPQEYRVGITPNAAREAVAHGHRVSVETNAGVGAGFTDADYIAAGADVTFRLKGSIVPDTIVGTGGNDVIDGGGGTNQVTVDSTPAGTSVTGMRVAASLNSIIAPLAPNPVNTPIGASVS